MKVHTVVVTSLVAASALLVWPSGSARAQGKGGVKVGGAKVGGATVGGAKIGSTTVGGARVGSIAKTGAAGTVIRGNTGIVPGVVGRPSSIIGGVGTTIIVAPGFAGPLYGYNPGFGAGLGYPGGIGNIGSTGFGYSVPITGPIANLSANNVMPGNYQSTPYANNNVVNPEVNNLANAANSRFNGPPRQYSAVSPDVELAPLPSVVATAGTAMVQVSLPVATAELWFNGVKAQAGGLKREFVTPELAAGQTYTYEIRAKWTMNGKDYDQTRTFNIQAGSQVVINVTVDTLPAGIKI